MPGVDGPICVAAGTSQVPVEGGVLDMDGHRFLDSPGMAVYFLMYYIKVVWIHWMASGGAVQVDG